YTSLRKCPRATPPKLNKKRSRARQSRRRKVHWPSGDLMSASNQILIVNAASIGEANFGLTKVRPKPAARLKTLAGNIRAFFTLAKPEITLMVMISAGVGSLMAAGSLRPVVLVHTVLGIGLLAAGTSALNQYLERELDGRMRRTARRPLPA